ncbi:carboxypeptidase-like regulatory domain-containing protein [Catalinimonas niigatensis]|uniref:carboxypeptidase-like regulatory domain-containing protein n=1 Tax=Catalinimonas niigatensis TaxID=1397264 RepID=UPI00266502BF|nr:carboxypeptidase-like regulatory domain-containing protein [Catalinimonas niigatensis]WPP49580.1 carboxypeptidase-like regulatory domain-containing protein [Catalinimonas niigatensis]
MTTTILIKGHFLKTIVVLILSLGEMHAQILKGEILDYMTDSTVAFANVYFNASYTGTTSNLDGHFELNTKGYQGQAIVVSCVGYESLLIEEYSPGRFYRIYLRPQLHYLREVIVEPDDMPWRKKWKLFKQEFLGRSFHARQCSIENPDDLSLVFFKSTATLEAFSEKPLVIHNHALGYKITYFLDAFKKSEDNLYYQGNSVFEEDTTLSGRALRRVNKRRAKAYQGSRMHFFRALWNHQLQKEDFRVMNQKNGERLSSRLLTVTENKDAGSEEVKYLLPACPLEINHLNEISYIGFHGDSSILFKENGFFDPKGLFWEGKMARQRVGDLLPFEYAP